MDNLMLIPYCERDGQRTLPDSYMQRLWERMVTTGVVQWLFYDGLVRTQEAFLGLMKNPTLTVLIVALKGAPEAPIGFCWLNNWENGSAEIHFTGLRSPSAGRPADPVFGRFVLSRLFALRDSQGQPLLDVIIAQTPAWNWPALKYITRCGMQPCGEIPDGAYLAYRHRRDNLIITAIKREDCPCESTPRL